MPFSRDTIELLVELFQFCVLFLAIPILNLAISEDLAAASGDVRTVIDRIEQGEGSIGRLLRDEEIFEDMREFVRELKRRPWRIIWKE